MSPVRLAPRHKLQKNNERVMTMTSKYRSLLTGAAVAGTAVIFFQFLVALHAQDKTSEPGARVHQPAPENLRWEHLALQHDATQGFSTPELSKKMITLGQEGWELVSVTNLQTGGTTTKTAFYFKRRIH